METSDNPAPEVTNTMDSEGNADSFEKVKSKKSQKRKRAAGEAEMDSEDTVAPKRPQFPPISGDRLTVKLYKVSCVKPDSP